MKKVDSRSLLLPTLHAQKLSITNPSPSQSSQHQQPMRNAHRPNSILRLCMLDVATPSRTRLLLLGCLLSFAVIHFSTRSIEHRAKVLSYFPNAIQPKHTTAQAESSPVFLQPAAEFASMLAEPQEPVQERIEEFPIVEDEPIAKVTTLAEIAIEEQAHVPLFDAEVEADEETIPPGTTIVGNTAVEAESSSLSGPRKSRLEPYLDTKLDPFRPVLVTATDETHFC